MQKWKVEALFIHRSGDEIDWYTGDPGASMRAWLNHRYKNMTIYQDLRVRVTHLPSGTAQDRSIDRIGRFYRIRVDGLCTIDKGVKLLKDKLNAAYEHALMLSDPSVRKDIWQERHM